MKNYTAVESFSIFFLQEALNSIITEILEIVIEFPPSFKPKIYTIKKADFFAIPFNQKTKRTNMISRTIRNLVLRNTIVTYSARVFFFTVEQLCEAI